MASSMAPAQAVDIFNLRTAHIKTVNDDIADWLQERRRVEEQYAQGLRALSRKKPPSDSSELGVFTTPWQKIVTSAESLADSHMQLARKIETDVERPLRNFVSHNAEMQQISTMKSNLATLAKDAANSSRRDSQWNSQSPYMFETLQAADESRVNHLRNVLTQFQTHEVDQVERNRVTAEQCLNALLNVETADEIKAFALRTSQGHIPNQRGQWRERQDRSGASAASPLARNQSGQNVPDAASDRSASPEKKGRLSGIKRLGTVLSRRNKKELPATPPSSSRNKPSRQSSNLGSSTNNAGVSSLGGADNGRSSLAQSRPDSFAPAAAPAAARSTNTSVIPESSNTAPRLDRPALGETLSSDDVIRPAYQSSIDRNVQSNMTNGARSPGPSRLQEPLQPEQTTDTSFSNQQMMHHPEQSTSDYVLPPITDESLYSAPLQVAAQHPQDFTVYAPQTSDTYNGLNDLRTYGQAASSAGIGGPLAAGTYAGEPHNSASTERSNMLGTSRESDGYSSRATGSEALSQIDHDSSAFASSTATQPYNLDIRNAPIAEEGVDNETAMASVANALRAQAGPAQVPKARGRRDVRNTVFMSASPLGNNTANDYTSPQGYTATQSGYGIASPISAPQQAGAPFYGGQSTQRSMSQDDNTTSDAYSARSAMTASNAAPTVKHPDMHQSGLNSSIVETVSAWFDNGMITRAVVIGELALAHNSTSNFPGAAAAESIRLENFHSLEKVAPNPAFVKQLQDRAGEYTIDTSSIARTAVAFKYQVHLDTTSMARQAPLLLVPSWKVEATQTSVILNYSLNPAFLASTPQQQVVTISNVVITLHLDGATATSCLSKPTGTFSRERSAIYWSLDDLVLRADQGPQRLLARFVTESEARPGRAEARWEIGGGQAERLGSGLHVSQLDSAGATGDTDPFADEENATAGAGGPWKRVGLVRKLVSGTYIAN